MKAVILAGGLGTRLSEETHLKPKPMVEIGGKPILWHIMKIYSAHGVDDFIICLGYKGYVIKEYFANDTGGNRMQVHQRHAEPWKVTLVDTGENTMTGGRLKRVAGHLGREDFCFTYGDTVADVDVTKLVAFHRKQGTLATVTTAQAPARFGVLKVKDNRVVEFKEKPPADGSWINRGFFVLSPKVLELIEGDETVWEQGPLETLAKQGNLSAYVHHGFSLGMDTLHDRNTLEAAWNSGRAPWKLWA
jgi:glucose-1-phosphate cytidylyltransferase